MTAAADDMVALPAGRFRMGSDGFYPEEAPEHDVAVPAFRIDRHPVTNRQFAAFVAETGYISVAERARTGALVFRPSREPIATDDWRQWWRLDRAAHWRKPEGKGTVFAGRLDHPVVAVAYEDAAAYAAWAGKRLPSEAEWEYAAWGGREGSDYSWGDTLTPDERPMANIWQGRFPVVSDRRRWWTTAVGSYPANGFGLFDLIGNVWEWTRDWYMPRREGAQSCCGAPPAAALDPASSVANRVVKGGSFLCSPYYCARYRPAARQPQAIDTATCHIGFRCVVGEDEA